MLSFSHEYHCVIIEQYFPGQSKKVDDCITNVMRMYPGSTMTGSEGVFPREHRINVMTEANAKAAVEWLKKNH